jgi:uncharacterized RDD family membrane protein YckC
VIQTGKPETSPLSQRPSIILASFQKRIRAFVYDYLIIATYLAALVVLGVSLSYSRYGKAVQTSFANPIYGELIGFFLLTLPVVLYFAVQESSAGQATWGKRKTGLRVTDLGGNRLTLKRSLLRSAVKFAPWELSHALIFRIPGGMFGSSASFPPILADGFSAVWIMVIVYAVSGLVGEKHQTLYDRVAGTLVVVWKRRAHDYGTAP